MSTPISYLRDSFDNNRIDPAWGNSGTVGSATLSETSSQSVLTLPSSTAGSHAAYYQSSGAYDLAGGSFVWNIAGMLSTAVAASAYFQLLTDNGTGGFNQLVWKQLSGTITARTTVAGVDTQLFTAAWSASTYKYLRIRENAGNIIWESSTNGTSWTSRAVLAAPFAVTSMMVQWYASCGNVASPGQLKLDDVNLILPALSTNWRWIQCERYTVDYHRSITLATALPNTAQGCLMTCESLDASGNPVNPHWYAGPMGSASGGYNALVEYSSLASAQNNAVIIPGGEMGRWDLPVMVNCRTVRLYMRSITGSSFDLGEFYPRRLVQADDVETEVLTALHIAAGSITADRMNVLQLSALSADMGALTAGSITGGTIRSAASGPRWEGNSTHLFGTDGTTTQWEVLNSTGKFAAGAGNVVIDANGIAITAAGAISTPNVVTWKTASRIVGFLGALDSSPINIMRLEAIGDASNRGIVQVVGTGKGAFNAAGITASGAESAIIPSTLALFADKVSSDHLNLGTAASATTGEVRASGAIHPPRSDGTALFALDGTTEGSALSIVNNGTAKPFSNARTFSGLMIISETAVNGNAAMFLIDGGGNVTLIGAAGATWSTAAATASKTNVYITGSAVTIENKLGSTASYNIMALRTRTS